MTVARQKPAAPAKKAAHVAYKNVSRSSVPTGRTGKHKDVVTHILRDLGDLKPGLALKIAIADLPDTKANVRSALNRETRKQKMRVSTATDKDFLYIWNEDNQ